MSDGKPSLDIESIFIKLNIYPTIFHILLSLVSLLAKVHV